MLKVIASFFSVVIVFLLLNCSGKYDSDSSQFVDYRDQQTYDVIEVGTQKWLGANLNYQIPNSFCYDNKIENCTQYGRLYNYQEAKTVCPQGWRLPSEADWRELEQQFGMEKSQMEAFRRWRGTTEGFALIDTLKIKFTGKGSSSGTNFLGKDQLVYYWVDEVGPSGAVYSRYRMFQKNHKQIYSDQVPIMDLCCVRCIKN
jgi:uncharacterized protein (TIGR02145 family)